jgi:hypothetical protein
MRMPPPTRPDPLMTVPTHRPLPDDPGIASLDERVRSSIAAAWRSRASNELTTSTVFATLTRCLVGLRAPHEIVRQAAVAVADEVRHAEICVHVARAYWSRCPAPDPGLVVDEPARGGDEDLTALLFAVMQSCVNEGVASVYLQRCLAESRYVLAHAAVRDILEDEIHHARFGWSLLSSNIMRSAWRTAVAEALPALLQRVSDAWMSQEASGLPAVPRGHGTIEKGAMSGVVRSAYEDLVLPGFEKVGIDAGQARAWAARQPVCVEPGTLPRTSAV